MFTFDKTKLKNKDKVNELKENFIHKKIDLKNIPKDILVELFILAINRIDDIENVGEYDFDERYFKDINYDRKCIVEDLFNELEKNIELDVYK